MSSNQAVLSAVIGILFLLIVLNDQLIKPVEIIPKEKNDGMLGPSGVTPCSSSLSQM
jgi:hypothetical protein